MLLLFVTLGDSCAWKRKEDSKYDSGGTHPWTPLPVLSRIHVPPCNRTCETKTGLFSHQKTHLYQTEGDIIIGFDGQP